MAGAGYKLFNTGDVLTAAQVNTYLQEQVVMVFASATARTTALSGVLAEGMVSYLKDTDSTEVYNGSAWVAIGNTGDITGVTTGANSGLTGGATSGTADIKLNFTAKGQLAVGSGSGTTGFLTVGANGTTIVADSSETLGVKWQAPAAGGKVLQVVFASTNTLVTNNTSTYEDSGLSATITPSSTSSKVLVILNQNCRKTTGSSQTGVSLQLFRGATSFNEFQVYAYYNNVDQYLGASIGHTYLDSPNTTSATTYKTKIRNSGINAAGVQAQHDSSYSTMTLLEIGA